MISLLYLSSYVFPLDPDSGVNKGLHINASIGGGNSSKFMIDTGSTGIVVARQYLGKDIIETGKQFRFEYSSSHNTYEGFWVLASVTFSPPTLSSSVDSVLKQSKSVATTIPMMIRRVDKMSKPGPEDQGSAPVSITDPSQISVRMLGIGFNRSRPCELDIGGFPIPPDINPFLLLKEMCLEHRAMTPGYILTPNSITLGITNENSQGFEISQLVPQSPSNKDSDWLAPKISVDVPTASIQFDAWLLVDTGLHYAIVQAPSGIEPPLQPSSTNVADGQEIRLTFPGQSRPTYDFIVGTPYVAPDWVSWRHDLHNGVPFINTSRHALSQCDYLYDAKTGRLGFRARASVDSM
jgi:hypothetical protein